MFTAGTHENDDVHDGARCKQLVIVEITKKHLALRSVRKDETCQKNLQGRRRRRGFVWHGNVPVADLIRRMLENDGA